MTETSLGVLVVDSDDVELRRLVYYLGLSFEVAYARSGAEALALLSTRKLSVLVSACELNDMRGLELVEKVRSVYPGLAAVIITTGYPKGLQSLLEERGILHLARPFLVSDLHYAIRAARGMPLRTVH